MSVLERISELPLTGAVQPDEEVDRLSALPINAPEWLTVAFRRLKLAGTRFSLSEAEDASGMGVEMRWMTPAQIVEETTVAYPGVAAVKRGYLPVGQCLEGSGDPYFLRLDDKRDDPAIVRIPHEAIAAGDALADEEVEVVADTLSEFLCKCTVD
ncbi:MAG: SMI1/KNR4 family protein [Planctomycetes bacterium]|nr:SMI1/KNR4 family protein [Planctomycetota bacterium]